MRKSRRPLLAAFSLILRDPADLRGCFPDPPDRDLRGCFPDPPDRDLRDCLPDSPTPDLRDFRIRHRR
ncbi:MAG: hypothetical protein JO345_22100 [Streptosporangiaceae bacterium]|nr:hypothetical protein [Streptosporangiaceae bacterium]